MPILGLYGELYAICSDSAAARQRPDSSAPNNAAGDASEGDADIIRLQRLIFERIVRQKEEIFPATPKDANPVGTIISNEAPSRGTWTRWWSSRQKDQWQQDSSRKCSPSSESSRSISPSRRSISMGESSSRQTPLRQASSNALAALNTAVKTIKMPDELFGCVHVSRSRSSRLL